MGHDKFGKNPKETFHPGTQKVGGELFWVFFFCLFVLFLFGFFFWLVGCGFLFFSGKISRYVEMLAVCFFL